VYGTVWDTPWNTQYVATTRDSQIEVVTGSIISGNVREADSSILGGDTVSLYLDAVLKGRATTDINLFILC
jgi:hypothetical protein